MARQIEKPPLGVRPAWIAAWQRIGELAEGIIRQCENATGKADLCKEWASEIILLCEFIEKAAPSLTEEVKRRLLDNAQAD